jgi:sortase A
MAVASGLEFSSSPFARFRRYRQQRVPYFSRPQQPHDWHWVVAGIGKTFITLGLLMFAFVGYQLWGTGIQTAQAQDRLHDEFREKLAATTTIATTTTTISTTSTIAGNTTSTNPAPTTIPSAPPSDPVPSGEAIAILRIPRIGIDWQVVEGVATADLKDGPGHFRETVMPGQLGNSAIAGHRTTYGEPFRNLDQLQPGDLIEVITLVGTYNYAVTESLIVRPSEYAAVVPTVDPTIATLVLVTCDPAYTARNRLVVRAALVPEASSQVYAPPPTTQPPAPPDTLPASADTLAPTESTNTGVDITTPTASNESTSSDDDVFSDGWFSDTTAIPHVLGWGVLLFAIGVGAYFAGRAANRLYVCFLVGVVPFVIVLYFWFENVNRLLPPSL